MSSSGSNTALQQKHDALDRLKVDVESSLHIKKCT